jgi:hypothetical protein
MPRNRSEHAKQPPQPRSRRRWFRLGPGLLLAIAASAFLWWQFPPQSNAPLRIERTPHTAPVPPSAPEPAWLLSQQEHLEMSQAQFAKLNRLRARWDRDTRDLHGKLKRASAEFNRGMTSVSGSSLTLQQIQERAAPVSDLSHQLADARAAWWEEASQTLSHEQRQRAEHNWAQRYANNARPTRKE